MRTRMGRRWTAGQHSCAAVGCEWDDGRHDARHVIGFVSWAIGRVSGKSDTVTPRQTRPAQAGIWQKSSPRKVSKHKPNAHVPKTDTGGLV